MLERLLKQILQFPTQLILLLIGALLFIPLLGHVHLFDWDEINFAESAREMLLTRNYRIVQINFQPFYEKPPLFIWLQAYSMHCFGINEFAARLPNAICGLVTLLVVFNVGRQVFNSRLGVLWALLFAASILPHLYFKSGIIDPIFNLFIFLSVFFIYKLSIVNDFEDKKSRRRKRMSNILFSVLFIVLATLTKGPAGILLLVLTSVVYLVANGGRLKIELSEILVWWLLVFVFLFIWLAVQMQGKGMTFVSEFFSYQMRLVSTEDSGHGGPFYYHFIVLIIGVFPASALIIDAFKISNWDDAAQRSFKRWMIYLLCVVLVVFSIVQTKIVHYSSLCYYPITFLAAYYLNNVIEGKMRWTYRQTVPLFILCLLIVGALTGGIFLVQHQDLIAYYIKDDFAKQCINAKVYWSNNDIRFGLFYLACVIAALLLIQIKNFRWGIYLLLISSALFINTVMIFIVPRVEKYSQAAMIEFLESKKDENCLVETVGFKSYAHYFYASRPVPSAADSTKTHYLIVKSNNVPKIHDWYPNAEELYRKNGWVFYKDKR